jgi:ABC-type antimicrobial peptide transport system permease subunit
VFGGFAGVALLIAVVGVAGVLAFSVSGRVREFGIRLAIGSQPRNLVARVVGEGAAIAVIGIVAGTVAGLGLMTLAQGVLSDAQSPGATVVAGSGVVLLASAVIASFLPARRAARVDVMQALRSE